MITVVSCCYISMSCHGMSAWVVFWLGHLAISDAGTFSRRHRWVFVGPCHLCVHGPLAFPFDSGFLTHTHRVTMSFIELLHCHPPYCLTFLLGRSDNQAPSRPKGDNPPVFSPVSLLSITAGERPWIHSAHFVEDSSQYLRNVPH